MRKLVLASVGAVALALSSAAGAVVAVTDCTMTCTGPTTVGDQTTIAYGETGLTNPFTEWVTFSNTLAGLYTITLSTSSPDVNFTSQVLSGPGGPYNLDFVGSLGPNRFWGLDTTLLEAGIYTLTLQGTATGGALTGNITINPAIPEPGTWAMMLLGFGAVGYAMRRRRRDDLLPQIA